MNKIFVLVALTGKYVEEEKENLIASSSKEDLEEIWALLELSQDNITKHDLIAQKELTSFMSAWLIKNPDPGILKLPRPTRPNHPQIPWILTTMSAKEKNNNPVQIQWKKDLKSFQEEIAAWKKLDDEINTKEVIARAEWRLKKIEAEKKFLENEYVGKVVIMAPYNQEVWAQIDYIRNTNSWSIEEIDCIQLAGLDSVAGRAYLERIERAMVYGFLPQNDVGRSSGFFWGDSWGIYRSQNYGLESFYL